MTAGVPGTGIGGLFYLMAALLLPVRGLLLRLRGGRVSWRMVAKLLFLAIGVFLGIWATWWFLGLAIVPAAETAEAAIHVRGILRREYAEFVRWAAILAGFVTLAAVLIGTQVARLVIRRR
jgi:drug/metabolite transporter (DMT)-like permease